MSNKDKPDVASPSVITTQEDEDSFTIARLNGFIARLADLRYLILEDHEILVSIDEQVIIRFPVGTDEETIAAVVDEVRAGRAAGHRPESRLRYVPRPSAPIPAPGYFVRHGLDGVSVSFPTGTPDADVKHYLEHGRQLYLAGIGSQHTVLLPPAPSKAAVPSPVANKTKPDSTLH